MQHYSLYHVIFVTLDAGERPFLKRRRKKRKKQQVETTEEPRKKPENKSEVKSLWECSQNRIKLYLKNIFFTFVLLIFTAF
jgi:hypothetical protein